MKILIFSAFDPIPSDEAEPLRYAFLAEAYLKQGHTVHYVTSSFFHLFKTKRKSRHWFKNDTNPEGLRLTLLDAPSYQRNVGLGRLWNHYILAVRLRKYVNSLESKDWPDLVISATPPLYCNYYLSQFCKRNSIPFVLDIQDLWPDVLAKAIPVNWLADTVLYPLIGIANQTLRNADAVTAVSEDYIKAITKKVPARKTGVFHIGIRTELFLSPQEKESPGTKMVFLGAGQNNRMVDHFSDIVAKYPEYELTIAGRRQSESFKDTVDNVKEIPWVPFIEFPVFLKSFDIGIILVDPDLKIAFPNKVFAYFAAGLPVISNIRGGELARLIQDNKLGITIEDDKERTILDAISYCRNNFNFEDRMRIADFAKKNFNVTEISGRYVQWTIDLLKK
jgi:glycosyltransferase involved in cell wall biosynthesis